MGVNNVLSIWENADGGGGVDSMQGQAIGNNDSHRGWQDVTQNPLAGITLFVADVCRFGFSPSPDWRSIHVRPAALFAADG